MSFDWTALLTLENLATVIDIGIVWFLIYKLLMVVRNTKSVNILNGVMIIVLFKLASSLLRLQIVDWILSRIIEWSVVAAIIIFQPEIRRGLEHLGRTMFTRNANLANPVDDMINHLGEAMAYMSKRRIGALIAINGQMPLEEYIKTGIALDAEVTSQLLINIFIPNTPLHDGAVIINNFKIASAASYLPLSEEGSIPQELGTRHRAAIGLSEVTDAIVIIVSEETGGISIAEGGALARHLSVDDMKAYLTERFEKVTEEEKKNDLFTTLFNGRGGKNS